MFEVYHFENRSGVTLVDVRLTQALAVLALSSCTACGVLPAASSAKPAPTSAGATPRQATPTPPATEGSEDPSPTFGSPPLKVASTARRFIHGVADYDSGRAGQHDFLRDLRSVTTSRERIALARSPRAHLDWRVLCDRHEQSHFSVLGVSRRPQSRGSVICVVVTGVLTTRSDLATTRVFESYSLTLTKDPERWQVSTAEGPGL